MATAMLPPVPATFGEFIDGMIQTAADNEQRQAMLDMLKDGAGDFKPELVAGTQSSMGMKAGPPPEAGEKPPPQEMGPFHPLPPPPVPQRTQFATGAQRDTQDGKPNFYECLSPFAQWRYGMYMADNAKKYGADNWTKGIPIESYIKSLERHLLKLKMELKYGIVMERGVDHASAILFNVQGLMHEQELKKLESDDDDED